MAARLALSTWAFAFVVLLAPHVAHAAERVWVVADGQKAGELVEAVSAEIEGRFVVASTVSLAPSELAALWKEARGKGSLSAKLKSKLTEQELRAVVLLTVSASKSALSAEALVVDVQRGNTQALRVPAGKVVRRVWRPSLRDLAKKVSATLAKLPTQASDEEVEELEVIEPIEGVEAVDVEVSERAAPRKRSPKRDADARVVARVGAGIGMRNFQYFQPLSEGLREYQVGARLIYRVGLNAYPLVWRGKNGYARSLGVEVDYLGAPTFQSAVGTSGASLDTSWREWRVGPALRLELTPFVLSVTATFGALDFAFASTDAILGEQLPSMSYRVLRLGGDVEVEALSWLYVHGALGLRLLMASGETIEQRFPNAEQAALDLGLGASVPLGSGVRVLAQLAYTHVYFDFKPQPGDARVAGGALDMYLAFNVGALYAF